MTYRELYKKAFGLKDEHHTEKEWRDIETEMRQVVAAGTPTEAASVIE